MEYPSRPDIVTSGMGAPPVGFLVHPVNVLVGRRSAATGPLADLLGQPYEKSFGPTEVAEPIGVFILDHFAAYKLRAVLA